MKQQDHKTQEAKFAQLAKRIRRKRLAAAVVLILLAGTAAIGAFNYAAAGTQARPPIAFAASREGDGVTSIETTWSLGFKQVCYQSKYGKNYSQRLWPWESAQEQTAALTVDQYRSLCGQLARFAEKQTQADDYFQVFSCFEGTIMDVEQVETKGAGENSQYKIYMKGGLFSFVEYDGNVYHIQPPGPQGWAIHSASEEDKERAQPALIVSARLEADELKVIDVQSYQTGGSGTAAIWEHFPKPVARRLVSTVQGFSDTGQEAEKRAYLQATACFGVEYDEEKRLECDLRKKTITVYKATYGASVKGAEEARERLVKQEKLKKKEAS